MLIFTSRQDRRHRQGSQQWHYEFKAYLFQNQIISCPPTYLPNISLQSVLTPCLSKCYYCPDCSQGSSLSHTARLATEMISSVLSRTGQLPNILGFWELVQLLFTLFLMLIMRRSWSLFMLSTFVFILNNIQ